MWWNGQLVLRLWCVLWTVSFAPGLSAMSRDFPESPCYRYSFTPSPLHIKQCRNALVHRVRSFFDTEEHQHSRLYWAQAPRSEAPEFNFIQCRYARSSEVINFWQLSEECAGNSTSVRLLEPSVYHRLGKLCYAFFPAYVTAARGKFKHLGYTALEVDSYLQTVMRSF
ncbi:MAG: hypothetical protein OXT67_08870 [Zetaproteobacteria bacterium]|nr:hypothetical protein [Zetaproteobacteria bacterium]